MTGKKRILLIEKNQEIVTWFSQIKVAEMVFVNAADFAQTSQIINEYQGRFSAIIYAVGTGSGDVFEDIAILKNHFLICEIPILAIVNEHDEEMQKNVVNAGVDDIISYPLSKPVVSRRLINTIERYELRTNHIIKADELTGIYNFQTFCHKTKEMIRRDANEKYALIRLDIGRFKVINDLYGQEYGDRVLVDIANHVKTVVTEGTYGRIVSDHFAICIPAKESLIEETIARLDSCISASNLGYHLIRYFGIYMITDKNLAVDIMADRALLALNVAKSGRGSRVVYYDEKLRQELLHEQAIVAEMQQALEDKQFILYIQPKYNLITEAPCGGEVLVRWLHPIKGLVTPGVFIPIFEKNQFITILDEYVWEKACILLKRWTDEGRNPKPISVNVSRANLYNPNLCETLVGLTKKYDLQPNMLELEITESCYVDNPELLKEVLVKLHKAGFVVMMDDFGSGYSSLNMLKEIDVDVLKIDLGFLAGRETSGKGANILSSVVRMAKRISLPTIIEGIETKEQADFLKSIGCNLGQGFYYAKPMPVNEYENCMMREEKHIACEQRFLDDSQIDLDEFWNPNAQMSLLLNSIVNAVGIFEMYQGKLELVRANEGYFDLFGDKDGRNMLNEEILDRVLIDDRKIFQDAFQMAVETKSSEQVKVRLYDEEKNVKWVEVKIRYLYASGDRVLFYVTISDFTHEMEIQEQFRIQKEKYRLIVEHTQIEYFEYDIEKDYIEIHFYDMQDRMHHIQREHFGEKILQNNEIDSEDALKIQQALFATTINIEDKVIEFNARFDKSGFHEYRCFYTVIADELGSPKYIVGRFERKDELGEMSRYQAIEIIHNFFDNTPTSSCRFVFKDDDFQVVYANELFYEFRGYTKEEFFEVTEGNLVLLMDDETQKEFLKVFKDVVDDKSSSMTYDFWLTKKTGEKRHFLVAGTLSYEDDAVYVNGVEQDITER